MKFSYYQVSRLLITVGCALIFIVFATIYFTKIYKRWSIGDIWGVDFFAIWSYAKFLFWKPFVEIYNNDILLDFQEDLGACPKCLLPYAYPPFFLFYILPLGLFSYYLAYILWTLGTGCGYFLASFEQQRRCYTAFLTIFAPVTIASLVAGQTGLLSSALIVGGFRVVATRPILGGILFGLASFKPQLGILIPVALISARLWRTVAVACVTILVLVLGSGVAFGWSMWSLWVAKLLPHADWVLGVYDRYNPTINSSLISIGVELHIARIVQACVGIVVAITIWVCFRKGVTILAIALLFVGTFLATPYAVFYDMPMLTNAVLAVLRDEKKTNRVLTIPELIVLASTLILPVIMLETWRPALFRSLPLILLFGLIVWRIVRGRRDLAEPGALPPTDGASVR
jgi:hypothetical protein